MLEDIDKETVDFQPNFDDRLVEPTVLPSKIPNLLVNGSSGIAVGMATNIPPHNLREVAKAVELLVDKPDADHRRPAQAHQGPRLPDRRLHLRRERAQGRLSHRARQGRHARPAPWSRRSRRPGERHRRHRAALPGQQGDAAQGHRRAGQREEDRGHQRRRGTNPTGRHAAGHRAQARRDPAAWC